DNDATVVQVGRGRPARLMRPIAVPAFAVPMEITVRPNDERGQMALLGTLVVGSRCVDQIVADGSGLDGGTRQGRVDRAPCQPRLRKRVGTVISRIVVAVVVELPLTTVVPPSGFVKRRALATSSRRPLGTFRSAPRARGSRLRDLRANEI